MFTGKAEIFIKVTYFIFYLKEQVYTFRRCRLMEHIQYIGEVKSVKREESAEGLMRKSIKKRVDSHPLIIVILVF
jgi:hypothetical protein